MSRPISVAIVRYEILGLVTHYAQCLVCEWRSKAQLSKADGEPHAIVLKAARRHGEGHAPA